MRHGNLPDGNSDKVTWKYSKDLLTQQHCGNIILRHSGDIPQQRYWVFHLGVTGNIVEMYKRDIVDMCHWDVLVIYHWDVIGCFIWDLFEMLCRCTDGTFLIHPPKTPSWHSNKMSDVPLRCYGNVPPRCPWVFDLWRTCNITGTYRETLLRRPHNILLLIGFYLLSSSWICIKHPKISCCSNF